MSAVKGLRQNTTLSDLLYQQNYIMDFDRNAGGIDWAEYNDVGGTVAISSAFGTGTLLLSTNATINTGVAASSFTNLWPIAEGRELEAVFRVNSEDQGNDEISALVGMSTVLSQDQVLDTGQPDLSDDTMGLFKVKNDPNWWVCASLFNSGEQVKIRTNTGALERNNAETNGFQTLRVLASNDGGLIRYRFFVDSAGLGGWQQVQDEFNELIDIRLDASAGKRAMGAIVNIKNGTAANQKIFVDWWAVNAPRGDAAN